MLSNQARVSGYNIAVGIMFLTCIPRYLLSADSFIVKEYPELHGFLSSSITGLANGYQLELDCSQAATPIARTQIEFTRAGITKKMILNAYYINKKLLTAEEFKFIFCHELGHIRDKHHFERIIPVSIVLSLFRWSVLLIASKTLAEQNYQSVLKCLSIGGIVYVIGRLLLSKWLREGELYADAFSLGLTGNKGAAVSALKKRRAYFKSNNNSSRFLQWVQSLFADHPSEKTRIASLER